MTRGPIHTLAIGITALTALPAFAMQSSATLSASLTSDLPSGQTVGTSIQWTITSSSSNPTTHRLTISRRGVPAQVVIDYRRSHVFSWTPLEEGQFTVRASTRDSVTGEVADVTTSFTVMPRVSGGPMVTLTAHPLVALFSAPPCRAGLLMRVLFRARGSQRVDATTTKACDGLTSMNFHVAGLLERSTYALRSELLADGGGSTLTIMGHGPQVTVQTDSATAPIPSRQTIVGPTRSSSDAEDLLLQSPSIGTVLAGAGFVPTPAVPIASDLSGRLLWYYGGDPNDRPSLLQPVPGGTLLMTLADAGLEGQFLQEIDLGGRVLRETNTRRVSAQLAAMGQDPVGAFHHDALRLPDGSTAVIASVERVLQNVQGRLPVNILGDMIIVLDRNWQVVWVWNAFDHLDVRRRAVLGEFCVRGDSGCPPFSLTATANDWTHSNAVAYSHGDGNFLLSVRNQDWVIKIDYRDGDGSGEVLWRLGRDGDFTMVSNDPWPWLSHQHDARFVGPGFLLLYDNGNTRCADFADLCYSRGQVYQLDESTRTATLLLNASLNNYSFALGSAQPLANGNFHFNSGIQPGATGFVATSDEVGSDGSFAYSMRTDATVYRSWRLTDLYMSGSPSEALAYAVPLLDGPAQAVASVR